MIDGKKSFCMKGLFQSPIRGKVGGYVFFNEINRKLFQSPIRGKVEEIIPETTVPESFNPL